MNKSQLYERIAEVLSANSDSRSSSYVKGQAKMYIEAFAKVAAASLREGEDVPIPGVGTLKHVRTKPKTSGGNPGHNVKVVGEQSFINGLYRRP